MMNETRQEARGDPGPRGWKRAGALLGLAAMFGLGFAGCESSGGIDPNDTRYGQIGQVEVELFVPRPDSGSLHQVLTWGSSGAWSLRESISYRMLMGDETFIKNEGDPSPLAAAYASFIALVNEVEGLELWIDELSQDLDEPCGPTRTRIVLVIRDDARNTQWRWIRCADGSLSNLTPVDAGPDAAASRVVSAALLVRDATVSPDFVSAYHGSFPFGTLDRGEDTNVLQTSPVYILSQDAWVTFWSNHAGATPQPVVDFERELVVVAAVGARQEAGDSVEVRRILQVDDGMLTYVFERVPGDFCSPAARTHVPFHIVVSPRRPGPYRFADIQTERVACGG
jgi:hypothetical protein